MSSLVDCSQAAKRKGSAKAFFIMIGLRDFKRSNLVLNFSKFFGEFFCGEKRVLVEIDVSL